VLALVTLQPSPQAGAVWRWLEMPALHVHVCVTKATEAQHKNNRGSARLPLDPRTMWREMEHVKGAYPQIKQCKIHLKHMLHSRSTRSGACSTLRSSMLGSPRSKTVVCSYLEKAPLPSILRQVPNQIQMPAIVCLANTSPRVPGQHCAMPCVSGQAHSLLAAPSTRHPTADP